MKINFYMSMFLLITAIPFFLSKTKNTKTNKVEFVESKENGVARDTIEIFEIIDGKEEAYFMDFELGKRKRAYFYKDTLGINLGAGLYGGYFLSIELKGDEYTSKLTIAGCTWRQDLKIIEQRLEFEDFKLVHNGKLKGYYFCEAINQNKFYNQVEKVSIRGYFELDLRDEEEEMKLW